MTRHGHTRRSWLVALFAAPALLAGCGDDCEDRLQVTLPAGFDGAYVFEGTAGGAGFRCDYAVRVEGGEQVRATPGGCTGPVALRAEHHADRELDLVSAEVFAVFAGAPSAVEWTWSSAEPVGGAAAPARETGRLEPVYGSDDGCRRAEAPLP